MGSPQEFACFSGEACGMRARSTLPCLRCTECTLTGLKSLSMWCAVWDPVPAAVVWRALLTSFSPAEAAELLAFCGPGSAEERPPSPPPRLVGRSPSSRPRPSPPEMQKVTDLGQKKNEVFRLEKMACFPNQLASARMTAGSSR